MAKLKKLPGQNIIDGMKGKIDYYVWMGIPCARSWPKSPGHDRAPAVQATWPAFTWAAQHWKDVAPIVKEAYFQMSQGTRYTSRELFTKSYISSFHLTVP